MDYFEFNGFAYFSLLSEEQEGVLPETMEINSHPTSESILFRLLIGTIGFRCDILNCEYNQNINYSILQEEFTCSSESNSIEIWRTNKYEL